MVSLYWKPFLPVLLALSGAGFVASVAVHILGLLKIVPATGGYTWALHGGIFVVWLPAVLLMQQLLPKKTPYNQKDVWKIGFRGCPAWFEKAFMVLFYYAIANFVFFFASAKSPPANGESPELFRGFSGHWMIFYGAAAGVFCSAMRVKDEERRCPSGHAVSWSAKFCDECGLPVSGS